MTQNQPEPVRGTRWTRGQIVTLAALTLGYTGFYLCRSNYSVAKPKLLEEFGPSGLDKTDLGDIDSLGTLCYAGGKVVAGIGADFVSAKGVFVGAMLASIAATIAFAMSGGKAGFLASWCVNRVVQSSGWGALTKIASHWFAPSQYGRAMAILALSYFFGDAFARLLYGELLAGGMGWRGLYAVGAASLGAIALACILVVRNDPRDAGEPAIDAGTASVFGAKGNVSKPEGLLDLLVPFLTSPSFWLVCLMSAGLTFARETFNAWTPTYLKEQMSLSAADAARSSSLFPLFGGISVLFAGWISDRLFGGRRGLVMFLMLLPATACLLGLAALGPESPRWMPRVLIAAVALSMLGPYAFLSGAIALDIGSKRGSATAAGLVDAVGYFAGVMAGRPIASIAQERGWGAAFTTLAVALGVVTVAAGAYWLVRDRARPDA